jgi:hypothetical protein
MRKFRKHMAILKASKKKLEKKTEDEDESEIQSTSRHEA